MKIKSNWDNKKFNIKKGDIVEMSFYMNYVIVRIEKIINRVWFLADNKRRYTFKEIIGKKNENKSSRFFR